MKSKNVEENNIKYTVCNNYGTIFWYKFETYVLHRENGPAVECNGSKFWYKDGKRHRLDGPAIIYFDGRKEYWINDKYLKDIETDSELMIKVLLE